MRFNPLLLILPAVAVALRPHPNYLLQRREELPPSEAQEQFAFEANFAAAATQGPPNPITIPTKVEYPEVVKTILKYANKDKVIDWVKGLIAFPERYWKSENGVNSALWIRDQALALNPTDGTKLTASLFNHTKWAQPSVIIRYESAEPTKLRGIVITGSHFDTISYGVKNVGSPNPAADDCASGSVAVFETLRTMVLSGFIPQRPIEFHFYAAEEVGLLGSIEVSEAYAKAGVEVVAYNNLDQSGLRVGSTPVIGVLDNDYTTPAATQFLRTIIDNYSLLNWTNTACEYACTDHAPWYRRGYEAVLAFESHMDNAFPYNDRVKPDGSFLDTFDVLDFDHIMEFVKTTVGFTTELSLTGWVVDPNEPQFKNPLINASKILQQEARHPPSQVQLRRLEERDLGDLEI
ncbi:hypothetical protein HDU97_002934 [Phlyctochytrium planicorne]|nr:hypothetical protein HDU97_002934 [Phlyctochytrium planicorne]